MLRGFYNRFKQWERDYRHSFGNDISTPAERARSWRHYLWVDHGILRYWWRNFEEIAPGVYRSNHPHHARFEAYRDIGIKSVLNLRGPGNRAHYLFEVESLKSLGMALHVVPMGARVVPTRETLQELFAAFDTIEKPFLMHCKSGADRTGIASAFYLLDKHNVSDAEARKHLSFRYIHIRKSKTGILDFVLNAYLARRAETGIALRDWVATEYDSAAVYADYKSRRQAEKIWQGW
ncbi:tyrosine-protein phosphatase [Yoonia sp. 208BN28-4]|uniref:tyrosine-protein phosphatase n=1 Tax=Yoonia sp. 208BN28-4 TaxID=3126505 RepID=UPI00309899D3